MIRTFVLCFRQVVGGPPRKRQRTAMGSIHADLELEAHILQHLEAIIVDSASDELLACDLMRERCGPTWQVAPN